MSSRLAVLAALACLVILGAAMLGRVVLAPGPGSTAPADTAGVLAAANVDPLSNRARAAIDVACRHEPMLPTESSLMVAVRSGRHVYGRYFAPDGTASTCHLVGDTVETLGNPGDFSTGCCEQRAVGAGELHWSDPQANYAFGRLGPGITGVRVDVEGGPTVIASVLGSWFGAAWSAPPDCGGLGADHSACPVVRYRAVGLDAGGSVVATLATP